MRAGSAPEEKEGMMARGTMKLVEPETGRMECKVCGSHHYASRKPNRFGGGWHRGSWQCVYREHHPDGWSAAALHTPSTPPDFGDVRKLLKSL